MFKMTADIQVERVLMKMRFKNSVEFQGENKLTQDKKSIMPTENQTLIGDDHKQRTPVIIT
jgi:hypothetical protein